jgi:thymidine kinase
MYSGKTWEVFRCIEREEYAQKRVVAAKPVFDGRFSECEIVARAKNEEGRFVPVKRFPAVPIRTREDLENLIRERRPQVLVLDESQFFDAWIFDFVNEMLKSSLDIQLIISGLNMDAWGNPFKSMPMLMAIAGEIRLLNAVCFHCKREDADMTQKKSAGSGRREEVGDNDLYEARCRSCWTPPPEK